MNSKEKFLANVSNQNNHRHLLWRALEATEGIVVEMGMGHGSTPYLHEYCQYNDREMYSYETDKEWMAKFKHLNKGFHTMALIEDWDLVHNMHDNIGVVLVDHAPGERRRDDLNFLRNNAQIVVAHDTEPAADHGYQMRETIGTYKFVQEYRSEGAWASMMSMIIDVREL